MGSLQDALLQSGLAENKPRRDKADPRPGKPARPDGGRSGRKGRKPGGKAPGSAPARSSGKLAGKSPGKSDKRGKSDLERAWAARQRAEKEEKERQKHARVADQEARRKRNLELDAVIEGRMLNRDDAEIPRYFQHLDKIRRVLCTPEQRERINAGQLGVVNLRGRYYIVEPDVLAQWRERAEDLVPDLSGSEPEGEHAEDYPPVPDDLNW